MFSEGTIITILIFSIIALFSEKHYIGRYTLLPYVLLIYFELNEYWPIIPEFLRIWLYIGFVIGIIAFISVLSNDKMPSWLYDLSYSFYSGKTVMGIYVPIILFKEYYPTALFEPLFFIATLLGIIAFWYVGINYFDNDSPK